MALKIFGRVWLLKNLFFFECLYFNNYDIRMLLFIFWLRNRLSVKYVSNWGNGRGLSKTCKGAFKGRGVEKQVIRYVRTKRLVPSKFCGIFSVYWFGQVHQSITARKENVVVFCHHNYDYFIYAITRTQSPSSIFESLQKNRNSTFLQKEILT